MHTIQAKQWRKRISTAALAGLAFGLLSTGAVTVSAQDSGLDRSVKDAVEQCRQVSASCGDMMKTAAGVLVFPSVVKADIIIGGAGGKGALIENGKITGYYNIGAASAGLQLGAEHASQVYIFRTPESLAHLKEGPDWKAGASAGVTLVTKEANSSTITGNILAYVFDSKGLQAGVSLDVFDVWQAGHTRPSQS